MITRPGDGYDTDDGPPRSTTRAAGILALVAMLAFAAWWAFGAHGESQPQGRTLPAPAISVSPEAPTSPKQKSSEPSPAITRATPDAATLTPGLPVPPQSLTQAGQRAEEFLRAYIAESGDADARLRHLRDLSTPEFGATLRSAPSNMSVPPATTPTPIAVRGRWSHLSEQSVILLADVAVAEAPSALFTLTMVRQGDTWVASALSAGHVGDLGAR